MGSWGTLQPLSPEFYSLLRHGLFLVLLIHLPYVGLLIGGSAVSLFLNFLGAERRDPACLRLSRELMGTVLTGKHALFLFGLLPLSLVWFAYARLFFEASPLPWHFWAAVLAILSAGVLLLHAYRSGSDRTPGPSPLPARTGTAGLLAVIFVLFLFSIGYGILFNPEKLPLLKKQTRFLLSWNGVVKFLLFFALFLGMTGGVILHLADRLPGGREGADAEYRAFARGSGTLLAALAFLAFPVFVLLDLVTLPRVALSANVFAASAVAVLLSLAVCLVLLLSPGEGAAGPGARVLGLLVLVFLAVLAHDHAAVGNAYRDRAAFLAMQAEAAEAERAKEAPREEPAAAGREAVTGEAVFENHCAGCHRFDIRVVGPPLSEAVPKYRGDVERLKGFIRNPVKVNPDYSSMPKLGLPEEEIDAVARYLIGKVQGGASP